MRLRSLVLEGFSSYRDRCELDLDDVHACAVVGDNGAGKSSLIDGIIWTLFGETHDRSAESVICDGSDSAHGEAVFEAWDGTEWTVTRERLRSGRTAACAAGGGKTIDGATEVSQALSEVLGGGPKVLCATAFARQGSAGLFAGGSAAQRRDLLLRGMPSLQFAAMLDEAQRIESEANERLVLRRDEVRRAADAAARVEHLSETLVAAERRAEAAQKHHEELEALAAGGDPAGAIARLRDARRHAKDLEDARTARRHTAAKLAETNDTIAAAAQAVVVAAEAAEAAEADAEKAADAQADAGQAAAEAQAAAAAAQARAGDAPERLRLLGSGDDDASCFVCGADLDVSQIAEIREEADSLLSDARAQADKAGQAARRAERAVAVSRKARDAAKQAAQAHRQASERAREAERAPDSLRARIAQLAERIDTLEPLAAGIAELEAAANEAAEHDEAARRAGEARVAARRAHEAVGAASRELAEARRSQEALPGLKSSETEAETGHVRARHVVNAMRPSGLAQIAMERVTTSISRAANRFLADMGEMQVRFRASDDKSRGMTIHARNSDARWRAYSTFSGGERMRLDVALRIALCATLRVRSRLLVLDEGWGALDSAGTADLSGVLHSIVDSGLFDQVLTISHVADAVDLFPQRIEVSKTGDSSAAEVLIGQSGS